jgi:hypothetical protein
MFVAAVSFVPRAFSYDSMPAARAVLFGRSPRPSLPARRTNRSIGMPSVALGLSDPMWAAGEVSRSVKTAGDEGVKDVYKDLIVFSKFECCFC